MAVVDLAGIGRSRIDISLADAAPHSMALFWDEKPPSLFSVRWYCHHEGNHRESIRPVALLRFGCTMGL